MLFRSAASAERLNALIVHRITDHGTARRLAALAGPRIPVAAGSHGIEMPGEVTTGDLVSLADTAFLLAVSEPRRLVRQATAIRTDRTR